MKKNRWYKVVVPPGRPLRWALPALALLGLLLLQWLAPGWSDRAEAWTVDARFRLRGVEEPRYPIVIVALDEASFQMMGDLQGENIRTWPRARWAELVTKIAAGKPRLIGLDVVFDTPGWDAGGDEALAEALAGAGNVILAGNLEQTEDETYERATLSPPISPLASEAAGIGVVGFPVDADGAVRKLSAFYRWGGQDYPSFPMTAASLYVGRFVIDQTDLESTGGGFPIHFRGPEETFTTISMIDVWSGEADMQAFEDTIVLVGYTTRLEQDRHAAPFANEREMAGVEIQANAIDTLLAGDWLHSPPAYLSLVLLAAGGVAALFALNLRGPVTGVVGLLVGVAVYAALGAALFVWFDFLLPLVAPLTAVAAVGGVSLVERMVFVEREKRQLRQRFAGVMSPERLQAVMDNWGALLEAERPQKEAAVLFADIRGFTNATETLMRQGRVSEMVRFLTAYLDAMTEAVFAEGGVVYDVVGDGLMILFGVPEPFADYASRAVKAAVDMALATESLQAVWPMRNERPLRMGIGVHCGLVVDAVVGRGRRVEYSVVGDPVNTSARIEAYCKEAMQISRPPGGQVPETVTVLISADVYQRVRDRVLVDESIPSFTARGKSDPLQVVRLLGLRGDVL